MNFAFKLQDKSAKSQENRYSNAMIYEKYKKQFIKKKKWPFLTTLWRWSFTKRTTKINFYMFQNARRKELILLTVFRILLDNSYKYT